MNTLRRINNLMIACYLPPVKPKDLQLEYYSLPGDPGRSQYRSITPVHDIIDRIDRCAGIITRYRLDRSLALVGERLARLERHIKAQEHPPFFWLGATAAHQPALTG